MIQEIDRMEGYVRDLLSYASVDSYDLQPVDPVAVCNRILEKRRPAIDRHRVAVEAPVRHETPQKVMADELLLEHALTSIVTNAVEAMPDGGRLTIAITPLPKGRTRIAIADTGHGIPERLMGRVSETYFTTKVRGLGLGLALAKGIIERCQGRLELTSTAGKGTTVVVDLTSA